MGYLDNTGLAYLWGKIKAKLDGYAKEADAVLSTPQTLTDAQKQQARTNIGAGTPYTLPMADATTLGGVKPVAKTDDMTKGVGVDANGGLYTEPDVWYVTLDLYADPITADKTPEEIYAAYKAGYSVYVYATIPQGEGALPLQQILKDVEDGVTSYFIWFGMTTQQSYEEAVNIVQISCLNGNWHAWTTKLVQMDDIPLALPNPNALTIKVGDTTTTYDGSADKTVEVKAVLYEQQTLTEEQKQQARENIGAAPDKPTTTEATLLATGWTGTSAPYTYTLSVIGVTADSRQEFLPALDIAAEQLTALQAANIQDGGQAEGTVTLKAFGTKPTIDLPIRVLH